MTSSQIPIQQDQSSGSTLTMGSRHHYRMKPIASKRVSFYKSGDPQFSALHMVINSRTFKTFDALLDSLSKKVPLPFGVRNITTPHGVHPVRTLEELEDGKAYICSDQKKVKPFDLEMASRRLPPWYHARPISARSRTLPLTNLKDGRFLVRDGPGLLRTPKRLTVFRNGDPGRKHTVILARRTTATFHSLLDHVSEVLRFHVVKLYTSDGRRVNSLPALIMNSGILVAAGRENFKPGSYSIQRPTPRMRRCLVNHRMQRHRVQLLARKNKLLSRSSKARNFSRASERYIANQISSSITGSLFELPSNTVGSVEMGTNNQLQSMEADTCSYVEGDPTLPPNDDIEKSFRVNSDGSMTVEMKVRLTVKEEEIVHWTTTLSRSSVANQLKAGCIPQNKPSCSTPDSNAMSTKGPNDKVERNEYMSNKEINLLSYENGRFCDEVVNDISSVPGNFDRLSLKRHPTPGHRGIQKRLASVESIRDVSAIDNQDNMVGTCTYLEETGSYEVTEKYHMVRECSSWPISKPRKNGSMEVNNNSPGTNEKSSSVAEVLQIHNSGEEITETVLKLYEQQSYCDSFCENMPWSQAMCGSLCRQQSFAETATCSSSNDYEMELQRPAICSEAIIGQQKDEFPLLSDLTQSHDLSSISKYKSDTLYTNYSGMLVNDEKYLSGKSKDDSALLYQRVKNKSVRAKTSRVPQSTGSDKRQMASSVDVKKNKMVKAGPVAQSASRKWVEQLSRKNGHRPNKKQKAAKLHANLKGTTHRFLSENICEHNIENSLHLEKDLNLLAENTVHGGPSNLNKRKNVLDVLSSLDSGQSRKILMREKSKEERRDVNEAGELGEGISVSSLCRSHSIVADCVEKSQPEATPHIAVASNVQVNKKPKVVFQLENEDEISPEMSEVNYKVNKPVIAEMLSSEGNSAKESPSHIPVSDSFLELSGGHGHKVDDLCAINQIRCLKPSEGEAGMRRHRTSIRIPARDEDTFLSRMTGPSDVRNILQQLCQSLRAIRQSFHQKQTPSLEKSQSLPDSSSHVASTIDSSSKMLLAFFSIVAAKEGVSDFVTNETDARNTSCTEALKVLEALKKIASTEHAEASSLTSLQLMQSWRAFQEFSDKVENLMDDSDLKCLFIPCPEGHDNQVGQTLDNHELVAEVKISEKYQDTLSAFANAVAACANLNEESSGYAVALISDIVNHTSESVTEEESISSSESTLKDDLLNGFYNHKTPGLGVQMISKKDTSVVSELKNHSDTHKRHNKTVDQKIRHKKESLDTKELAACLQEEAVCTEAQDSYAEDDIHFEERTCYFNKEAKCPEEIYNCSKDKALCREEHDRCLESKSTSVEERDGFAEGETNCLWQEEEHNNISAENEIGSAEWQDGRGAKLVSWVEDMERDGEKDSSFGQKSMEKQASFEGEKISCGQQIGAKEVQTDSEDKQAGPVGERDSDIEIKGSCDKELCDAEQFTSLISCTEEEATCIEGTLVPTEDATYDNEQMISEECKAYRELKRKTQKSNTVRYCETPASSEQELDNFAEQTNHVCFKQLSHFGNALDHITLVKNHDGNHEATHHGKFWGSHDKSQVSCREKQSMYVNRPLNEQSSTEHSNSVQHSAQIDVLKTSIADHLSNVSNISTDQAKIEEFMRETTEVCRKCVDKSGNEIHCVMKNREEEKPNQRNRSFRVSQSVKTLQSFSDTTSSLSSSLAFSYDSKGTLKKDHEGARVKSIKEMFLAKSNTKIHDDHKQLPSPITSDSSDYVPETSDSGGSHTQTSTNVSTEGGEDDCGRRSIAKGYVRRTIERLYGKSEVRVEEFAVGIKGKHKESLGSNSVGSEMSASHEPKTKITTDLSYFNATNSCDFSNDNPQCIAINGQVERSADVLNEWGLPGNQLSRNLPREMLGTQRGKEARPNESRLENGDDKVPYSHFRNHPSTLAAVSSSDIVELVEPEIPKCTYFNLPHGSDSDPFQDDLSSKSQNGAKTDDTALKRQDSKPADGEPKMWGGANGFLPQPPAVFRMPDNKVHPAPRSTAAQAVVLQPPKSDFNRPIHEQDTLEMLHFICGQHCPIL